MNIYEGLSVRAATVDDAGTVRAMVGEIAAHQGQETSVVSDATCWRDMLARPEVTVLLAEVGARPVGYVSAVRRLHLWSGGDVLALDDLYVRAGQRDQGVGVSLMTELCRRANGLTITWGVQPDNLDAIRFYERLGATIRSKVVCAWPPGRQPR